MANLSGSEKAEVRARWEAGERARWDHEPGTCDTCDELRRLDAEDEE